MKYYTIYQKDINGQYEDEPVEFNVEEEYVDYYLEKWTDESNTTYAVEDDYYDTF